MSKSLLRLALAILLIATCGPSAFSQTYLMNSSSSGAPDLPQHDTKFPIPVIDLVSPVILPRMSPDFALQTVVRRYAEQSFRLLSYSDETVMTADLPDYKERGEYLLKREYSAPNSLRFVPIRYTGDGFVKNNVLVRLLQSEVDHVEKDKGSDTAITDANYKFSHKTIETVNGRLLYIFNVKPRKRRVGLFKGKIYVDPYHGELVRVEGEVTKSPSLFIKKLEFVQEYTDVGGFNLPTHLHSVAKVRIIGRTVVDIFHRNYQARAANPDQVIEIMNAFKMAATRPAASN